MYSVWNPGIGYAGFLQGYGNDNIFKHLIQQSCTPVLLAPWFLLTLPLKDITGCVNAWMQAEELLSRTSATWSAFDQRSTLTSCHRLVQLHPSLHWSCVLLFTVRANKVWPVHAAAEDRVCSSSSWSRRAWPCSSRAGDAREAVCRQLGVRRTSRPSAMPVAVRQPHKSQPMSSREWAEWFFSGTESEVGSWDCETEENGGVDEARGRADILSFDSGEINLPWSLDEENFKLLILHISQFKVQITMTLMSIVTNPLLAFTPWDEWLYKWSWCLTNQSTRRSPAWLSSKSPLI